MSNPNFKDIEDKIDESPAMQAALKKAGEVMEDKMLNQLAAALGVGPRYEFKIDEHARMTIIDHRPPLYLGQEPPPPTNTTTTRG